MTEMRRLRGIELRYVLTDTLAVHGPATVADLVEMLAFHGFDTDGRPSKTVSDALRWEISRGRVRRLGRARYGPGGIPRATEHRIHRRVLALRAEALIRRLRAGDEAESLQGGQTWSCSSDAWDRPA